MTYGEAYTYVMLSDWVNDGGKTKSVDIPNHLPRMGRAEAFEYYGKKFRDAFKELGYQQKSNTKPEYKRLGFDSVDDMYDYYEANRYKQEMAA